MVRTPRQHHLGQQSTRGFGILVLLTSLVLAWLVAAAPGAAAQTTGVIVGKASDASGALVAGAVVSATNLATNVSRQSVTDEEGQYVLTLVPVGIYTVSAEKQGFEKFVAENIEVHVNESVRVDISLVVGQVNEVVTVQVPTAVVETRNATLGKVVDERKITELPLNERNFLNLATLQPGVVPAMEITSNNTPAFSGGVRAVFQVNGLRLQSNNFLLDGADNNEPFLGTAMATPSPDALSEFKILTNSFSAEFGGGGGSIVNIITRSGSNTFHAGVYEFFRNDVLDAANFFASQKDKLRRNQFGASLGGPVVKDKTFFFANYEGFRLREGITQQATVPSLAERAFVPPGGVDPVAASLLSLIPEPNVGDPNTSNTFVSSPVSSTDTNQFTLRVDHSLSSKNTLSGRYFFNQGQIHRNFTNTLFGISIDLPDFPLRDEYRIQNLAVSDVHFFSTSLINEARFGFNRGRFDNAISENVRTPESFGFNLPTTKAVNNMPLVAIAGFTALGTFNDSPSFRRENVFQFQDQVSWLRGKHSVLFGANILYTQMNIPSSDSIGEGAYLFIPGPGVTAFQNFLAGSANLFFQGGGITAREWRYKSYNFFIQDEWRIRPNFTLTFGLRYELPIPPTDTKDRVVALRPGQQSTVIPSASPGLLFVGDPGISRSTIETDKNNFAPRIGFAWDLYGNGKMSVRGGYGFYYDRLIGLLPFQFGLDPPFYIIPSLPGPFIASFGDPFGGGSPFAGRTAQEVADAQIFPLFSFLQIMDKDMRTPYIQQWNLSYQWQALKDMVIEAGYVATKSTRLPQAVNLNSARPTAPFQPFLFQVSNYQTTDNAVYHALQFSANKRFGHGLSFLASYTWSHSIDGDSIPVNFLNPTGEAVFPQDRLDLAAERGNSAFDVRHRFVGSFLYELPFLRNRKDMVGHAFGNWQVNAILTFQTGFPFTVLDTSDPNQDGDATDRPDPIGDPFAPGTTSSSLTNCATATRTPQSWFNPCAFDHPPLGSNGLVGRNTVTGPGISNLDFSFFKNFPFMETRSVQFRAEFFNLVNHPNFGLPVNDINSPNAGRILKMRLPSRQIQFALKLFF